MSFDRSAPQTVQYMGIHLTVQCEDPKDPFFTPQQIFPRDKEGGVYIGRAPSNDLQLNGINVSSVHCRIEPVGANYYLEDANSSNGTFVGFRRLSAGERYALHNGDVIRIAEYNITFRIGLSAIVATAQPVLESTMQLEQEVAQQFLNDPESRPPQLKVISGDQAGRVFDLIEYEDFLIGREDRCHLRLTDDAMSRQHAVLRRDWSGVTIRDMNSRNGVYINNRRIEGNKEVSLTHGDQISLGVTALLFHDPFAASLEAKLKHVVVEDDNTIDGATILPQQALARIQSKQNPNAKDIDIREPVSGKWRVPKRDKGGASPLPPAEDDVDPPAQKPPARPEAAPKQATTPKAAPPKQTAPKQTAPPQPVPVAPEKPAPPSKAAPPRPPSQSPWLLVLVLIVCLLVIGLAIALIFLLQ